jgi:hypothetical protein
MTISALSPIARGTRADLSHGGMRTMRAAASKSNQLLGGGLAVWRASQVTAGAQQARQSNWTTGDAPCAKYNDLRRPVLGDIGVKIDVHRPWAGGFRQALRFWNTVLAANFHETNLDACALRIVNASPGVLTNGIVARSQLTKWHTFRGRSQSVGSGEHSELRRNLRYRRTRIWSHARSQTQCEQPLGYVLSQRQPQRSSRRERCFGSDHTPQATCGRRAKGFSIDQSCLLSRVNTDGLSTKPAPSMPPMAGPLDAKVVGTGVAH